MARKRTRKKRAPKTEITLADFRNTLKSMVEGDRIHWSLEAPDGYMEVLQILRQKTDTDLLKCKLYSDLGMDAVDMWEMIVIFERRFKVFISGGKIKQEIETGVASSDEPDADMELSMQMTVEKYLNMVNKHMRPMFR